MLVVTDVSSHLQSLGSKEDFAQIVEMSISTNFLGTLFPDDQMPSRYVSFVVTKRRNDLQPPKTT